VGLSTRRATCLFLGSNTELPTQAQRARFILTVQLRPSPLPRRSWETTTGTVSVVVAWS